jgi:hypothetical protein
MSQKRYKNSAARRKNNPGPGGANRVGTRTPIAITDFADGSASTAVTFDQAVNLAGIPGWTDLSTPSITVTGATQSAPNVLDLVWNAAPTVAVSIPFEDPGIRNNVGGYVRDSTFTFPE